MRQALERPKLERPKLERPKLLYPGEGDSVLVISQRITDIGDLRVTATGDFRVSRV